MLPLVVAVTHILAVSEEDPVSSLYTALRRPVLVPPLVAEEGTYVLVVSVEGHRLFQCVPSLFDRAEKLLHPGLQVTGLLVDILRVAFPRMRQFLGRYQQLVCVGDRVL